MKRRQGGSPPESRAPRLEALIDRVAMRMADDIAKRVSGQWAE